MVEQRLELTWFNKHMALIPTEVGKYGYKWVDPSDPRYCEIHTLILDDYVRGVQSPKSDEFEYSERADFPPQDDNLLILGESGDVLEALTRVPELADKYLGKVKLIYIDPPFNTQQAFSSYDDALEHSIWLTMMRDRLLHMRKLLSDDGSIWVHLDHAENHRMRCLLDEVFGSSAFVAEIAWQKASHVRNDSRTFSVDQDVILVYAAQNFQRNILPPSEEMRSRFKSPDGDPRPWQSKAAGAPGARTHQGMVFGIQHPKTGKLIYPPVGNCWRFSQQNMLEHFSEWGDYETRQIDDRLKRAELCGVSEDFVREDVQALLLIQDEKTAEEHFDRRFAEGNWPILYFTGKDGSGGPRFKSYVPDGYGQVPRTLWIDTGRNDEAKREIQSLHPGTVAFSTPKPEALLERIIHIGSNPGDIVLDVFAGSGTTAAVAQKMGRRWVTCELLESTFNTFTRPRLEKVVNDQDPGGITRTKGERVAADDVELPEGVSPEDAAKFTSVLNKLIADDPEAKKSPLVKALKAAAKTERTKEVVNWRGGGGFQVARLSPACFDFDPELGLVVLTPEATGETLVKSVAANRGFHLLHADDDYVFDGQRGRSLLKVHEGVASIELVDELLSYLTEGESLVLAATGVADGVREHLRKARPGSRLVHIPDDIFRVSEKGGQQ